MKKLTLENPIPMLAVSLLLAGCPSPIVYDYSKEPDPRQMEFTIGVPDSLKITVWKNPELSTEGRVRPDGTITMPLIGDLQAAGKTPSQLRQEISRRLSTYVRDESAVVSVAVTDVQSYHFTVAGNVEHPGLFNERTYVTIADAIAKAGGINKFGSPDKVTLVRTHGGKVRRIPIDYTAIQAGTRPESNLVLLPGDTLIAE